MSLELAAGWQIDLDRGPDWLFVRLTAPVGHDPQAPLAGALWQLLEQEFTYRLVLELDDIPLLDSHLLGELVRLSRRIYSHGGMFRICGLSDRNLQVLQMSRLAGQVCHYQTREDAVMGHRPSKPK